MPAPQSLIKQPAESKLYTMEFAPALDSGETLTGSPTVTASPSGLTLASAAVSGTKCTVRASGGTAGVTYKVTFVVATSAGNTLEAEGYLVVKDL